MKGIVWYNYLESGLRKIAEIAKEYERCHIPLRKQAITTHAVTLYYENGDEWRVARASDCARGSACNISYIERSIPTELVEQVIKPCTKAFPYRAFNYYGEVDFNESKDYGV